MPQIIVTAKPPGGETEEAVMLRERVTVADFESRHFADQLVERLGWAVSDADDMEQTPVEHRTPAAPAEQHAPAVAP